ncbi:MAG: glycosyltransferase family 39 protein [Anaerolineales bacterium]|nr:glycosyltransferase family 39 protein [Anaerolineales bacterium]
MSTESSANLPASRRSLPGWAYTVLLSLVLLSGAVLRFTGLDWDQDQHLHPDERFLTMVETGLQPVGTPAESLGPPPTVASQPWRETYVQTLPDCSAWGGYFDTACSPLNPHNRGYTFYVYGTLPIFLVRYVADWVQMTGYSEVHLVGRALSALVDLLSVLLVYAIGARLYNRLVGVLGAAFSAFAVLQIQQSHFFTVDTFTNLFMLLALYCAVLVTRVGHQVEGVRGEGLGEETVAVSTRRVGLLLRRFLGHPLFWPSVGFGLALGMAVASKINAAPIALILPLAAALYLQRLEADEQRRQFRLVLLYLVLAAVVSLVAFRLFQPYAFSGPGFFGLRPNPAWLDNLRTLRGQTSGDVDFPPALQWARRPIWFSWQNLTLWGLGLPLGLLAWAGFLWMGWRSLKGEWRQHVLLWGWTGIYFAWQSLQWNSTMRYQLPVYPTLALIAAWLVFRLCQFSKTRRGLLRLCGATVLAVVLLGTFAWAYAFSGIYQQDHPRVAATRWMFQNFPGPVTLAIETQEGIYQQPLPFASGTTIGMDQPYELAFTAKADGEIAHLLLPHVVDQNASQPPPTLVLTVIDAANPQLPLAVNSLTENTGGVVKEFLLDFAAPLQLLSGTSYLINLEMGTERGDGQVCKAIDLVLFALDGARQEQLPLPGDCLTAWQLPVALAYEPAEDMVLQAVRVQYGASPAPYDPGEQVLAVELIDPGQDVVLASGQLRSSFLPGDDPRGPAYQLELDQPARLQVGQLYRLRLDLQSGPGALTLSGTALANESTWDDGLPLRMDGYDPFGGIYQGGLSFEMYWDDNQSKYERFVSTLDQADYILITSSRQWGSTTRLPERYPLTSAYYRQLLGCPVEKEIEWCYNVAQVGSFAGNLGFELVQVFENRPTLGDWGINDQFAEEAFTVYDHPKVFVFAKTGSYDPAAVRAMLGAVDLARVVHVTPKQADNHPGNLMLPQDRLAVQRQGGTWSELFDYQALQNRFPILAVVLWYLAISVLGWVSYPTLRLALPGLADRGYPLARVAGLLLLSYGVWLAGSLEIPFERLTITLVFGLLLVLGLLLAYRQRHALRQEWREKRAYFLLMEGLFLGFFIFGLLIRIGNPDLWHPWKGGEKPMDFSYFNALLKSTTFPPYDPWFAGGYINYYYYGFVLVGVPVKWLAVVPAIAYNLILPTLLALIAMGAFSIGWNLLARRKSPTIETQWAGGLMAAFSMAILGNLGTLRMFIDGFQRIAQAPEAVEAGNFLQKLFWTFQGLFLAFTGAQLPYRMDEWYWNPSRVIGYEHGNPINEFPYFTFLYGDLHAHLIALPLALLALSWALAVLFGRAWQRPDGSRSLWQAGLGIFLGGLTIGALYPVNLSDIYTYLPLGVIALGYVLWRENGAAVNWRKSLWVVMAVGLLVLAVRGLWTPYYQWYGQGYSQVGIWTGTRTPLDEYLTHWGAFLFVIISWMFYESIDWMAKTPLRTLRRLQPYQPLIWVMVIFTTLLMLTLGITLPSETRGTLPALVGGGVHVVWLVLPLAIWAGILLLRPGQSDAKRAVIFLTGTALLITLMVEIVVVSGDIGRMNTVFKFYLHAWTFFAVATAAMMVWLWEALPTWQWRTRLVWQTALVFFVGMAALYPLTATLAKINDRMTADAPHTLDGMAYMQFASYADVGRNMDLKQDYDAIRWLQNNIPGSPVIVEANQVEYHWGTRYTVYTGLPGVVGWNWHQRQQRTLVSDTWVWERVNAVDEFYNTTSLDTALDFLRRYEVSYIILGQLERGKYVAEGLEKFPAQNGYLWDVVYQDQETVIYKVRDLE